VAWHLDLDTATRSTPSSATTDAATLRGRTLTSRAARAARGPALIFPFTFNIRSTRPPRTTMPTVTQLDSVCDTIRASPRKARSDRLASDRLLRERRGGLWRRAGECPNGRCPPRIGDRAPGRRSRAASRRVRLGVRTLGRLPLRFAQNATLRSARDRARARCLSMLHYVYCDCSPENLCDGCFGRELCANVSGPGYVVTRVERFAQSQRSAGRGDATPAVGTALRAPDPGQRPTRRRRSSCGLPSSAN
jgi:hypothetical protein